MGVEVTVNIKKRIRRMTPLERTRFLVTAEAPPPPVVDAPSYVLVGGGRAGDLGEVIPPEVLDDPVLCLNRRKCRVMAAAYALAAWLDAGGYPDAWVDLLPTFCETAAAVAQWEAVAYAAVLERLWDRRLHDDWSDPPPQVPLEITVAREALAERGEELAEPLDAPTEALVDVEVELYRLCGLVLNDEDGLTDDDVCAIYNRVEWAIEAYRLASGSNPVTYVTNG